MKHILLFTLTIGLILSACVSDTKAPKNKSTAEMNKTVKRDHKLYANFTDNPTTQDQIDENALIEYAVTNDLDVKKTASGLYYVLEQEGDGLVMVQGQPFKAHYSGYFLDGKIFDSSYQRGTPIAASIGSMIPAWNEALTTFKIGSKMKLLIPSKLAYGARGFPGFVPPNSPLVFDMHILPVDAK
jgi:FKBP-type peptidyl-prolyl cis-trans isomerase